MIWGRLLLGCRCRWGCWICWLWCCLKSWRLTQIAKVVDLCVEKLDQQPKLVFWIVSILITLTFSCIISESLMIVAKLTIAVLRESATWLESPSTSWSGSAACGELSNCLSQFRYLSLHLFQLRISLGMDVVAVVNLNSIDRSFIWLFAVRWYRLDLLGHSYELIERHSVLHHHQQFSNPWRLRREEARCAKLGFGCFVDVWQCCVNRIWYMSCDNFRWFIA